MVLGGAHGLRMEILFHLLPLATLVSFVLNYLSCIARLIIVSHGFVI